MTKRFLSIIIFSFCIFIAQSILALVLELPTPPENMIGESQTVESEHGDNLQMIARRYEMGFDEVKYANPRLSSTKQLPEGTTVIIPSFFILPNSPHNGITINYPELRLYYYPPDSDVVVTEPVSAGRPGWSTPLMTAKVVEKIKDPEWVVPDSIMEYSANKGIYLPRVVPPGPENPLGEYALRLSMWSILIHGTNQPQLIGKRVSSGCIRMYPEDIEHLFFRVALYTPVYIINEPYKVGWYDHVLYLEVHPPIAERVESQTEEKEKIHELVIQAAQSRNVEINWQAVDRIFDQKTGMPEAISPL